MNRTARPHTRHDRTPRPGVSAAPTAAVERLEPRTLLTFIVVTTPDDVVGDDGFVSLREALTAANTNAAFHEAPAGEAAAIDRVRIDPNLRVNGVMPQFDLADTLHITDGVVLLATGARLSAAGYQGRVLDIAVDAGEQVVLDSAVVRDGNVVGSGAGVRFAGVGGAPAAANAVLGVRLGQFNGSAAVGRLSDPDRGLGGGLSQLGGRSVVRGTSFLQNTAEVHGGAFYVEEGSTVVRQSLFQQNETSFRGGAVAGIRAELTIEDSDFLGNRAHSAGGGIFAGDASGSISGVEFRGNRVPGGNGGGFAYYRDNTRPSGRPLNEWIIAESTFVDNIAEYRGGGLYVSRVSSTVTDTLFDDNRAHRGGGAAVVGNISREVPVLFERATFAGNTATRHGGGLYLYSTRTIELVDSTFQANTAGHEGGGIMIDRGSGTFSHNSFAAYDTSFVGNAALRGGGIRIGDQSHRSTFLLDGVTVQNNHAVADPQTGEPGEGGGLHLIFGVELEAIDTLISGNSPDDVGGRGVII